MDIHDYDVRTKPEVAKDKEDLRSFRILDGDQVKDKNKLAQDAETKALEDELNSFYDVEAANSNETDKDREPLYIIEADDVATVEKSKSSAEKTLENPVKEAV